MCNPSGPTKDRKGLKPPKWTEKNIRAPIMIFMCHFMPLKSVLIIFNVEIFISQRNFQVHYGKNDPFGDRNSAVMMTFSVPETPFQWQC